MHVVTFTLGGCSEHVNAFDLQNLKLIVNHNSLYHLNLNPCLNRKFSLKSFFYLLNWSTNLPPCQWNDIVMSSTLSNSSHFSSPSLLLNLVAVSDLKPQHLSNILQSNFSGQLSWADGSWWSLEEFVNPFIWLNFESAVWILHIVYLYIYFFTFVKSSFVRFDLMNYLKQLFNCGPRHLAPSIHPSRISLPALHPSLVIVMIGRTLSRYTKHTVQRLPSVCCTLQQMICSGA